MPIDQERIADVIRAFEAGEIVVVPDADDRENEGDLIVAAVHCTAEKMAFIIRHTSGIVCAPMTGADARRDYRHGTTTGISAEERMLTVRGLANPNSGAADFVRPGHIFPLVAREGGVLMRSGHTEAAVDLCRLAGLPPVGVISELMNEDGTVTRGAQVAEFARKHGLKMISVAELIAWRQRRESLVERVSTAEVNTLAGPATAITYKTPWDPMHHLAVVYGDIRGGRNIPVRLHIESVIDDVFGASDMLRRMMQQIAKGGRGVVVYLREGSVGVGQTQRRQGSQATMSTEEREAHGSARSRESEWLEIGLGAQILRDLGIESIELLASRERRYVGLDGFGIEISRTIISE